MADQADWLVKYTDGSTFTNLDGLPHEAPRTGVQGIAVRDEETGRLIIREHDYYFWNVPGAGFWSAGTCRDLDRYLETPGFYKVVLRGQWVDRETYRKRLRELIEDPSLPSKSAWDSREVRD